MPTKNWDGQNANHNQKFGQNANLWLAFCLVGILSGWHFVLPPLKIGNTIFFIRVHKYIWQSISGLKPPYVFKSRKLNHLDNIQSTFVLNRKFIAGHLIVKNRKNYEHCHGHSLSASH